MIFLDEFASVWLVVELLDDGFSVKILIFCNACLCLLFMLSSWVLSPNSTFYMMVLSLCCFSQELKNLQ